MKDILWLEGWAKVTVSSLLHLFQFWCHPAVTQRSLYSVMCFSGIISTFTFCLRSVCQNAVSGCPFILVLGGPYPLRCLELRPPRLPSDVCALLPQCFKTIPFTLDCLISAFILMLYVDLKDTQNAHVPKTQKCSIKKLDETSGAALGSPHQVAPPVWTASLSCTARPLGASRLLLTGSVTGFLVK